MDQLSLEIALSDLQLPEIRYFDTISSTNDTAAGWVETGALDYSIVVADEQTRGRGRFGHNWITEAGTGLAFSLVIIPSEIEQNYPPSMTARFTGLGALAVCRVLQNQYSLPAKIKWPNDVLVGNRKICGVLAEAVWVGQNLSALILGIGINIAANSLKSTHKLRFPATCIETELGYSTERNILLSRILREILNLRTLVMNERFLRLWEEQLAYLGKTIIARPIEGYLPTNTPDVKGIFLGLDMNGGLRIEVQPGQAIVLHNCSISVV